MNNSNDGKDNHPITNAMITFAICAASAHLGKGVADVKIVSNALALVTKVLIKMAKESGINPDELAFVVIASWDSVESDGSVAIAAANSKGGDA